MTLTPPMSPLPLILISLALLASCSSHASDPPPGETQDLAGEEMAPVPVIDELGYLQALEKSRPDLLADDCYDTLVLKEKYRAGLLARTLASYADVEKHY